MGGAVRSQSQTYTQYGVQQGGYTLYDVFTRYDVTSNLQVNFNLNNVFDKHYYTSISSTTGSNFIGEPRNFLATARYKF